MTTSDSLSLPITMYMQSSLPPRRLLRKTRLRLRLLRRRFRLRFLLRRLRTLRLRLRLLRLRRLLRTIRLYQRGRRETASAKSTKVRQPVNLQPESLKSVIQTRTLFNE